MLVPEIGRELAKDRLAAMRSEAERDGRARRVRRRGARGSLRLALGMRLVSAGYRLLGEAAEVR